MKKIIAIILSICLVFALCGCGKSKSVLAVEEAISALGEVSLESEAAITAAEEAFAALSDKEKEKVENAAELTAARETYNELLAAYEQKLAEEEAARIAAEKEAAEFETARMALVGDWVSPSDGGFVFLTLGEDGSAHSVRGSGIEAYGSWTLNPEKSEVTVSTEDTCRFSVGSFMDGLSLTNEDYAFNFPYMTLVKAEDFSAFVENYCTVVDLGTAEPGDYFGNAVLIEHATDAFGEPIGQDLCYFPNAAMERGLVYLYSRNVELAFSTGITKALIIPYAPMTCFSSENFEGARVTRAAGTIVYISADIVESVGYTEDGQCRVITLKDGSVLYERHESFTQYGAGMSAYIELAAMAGLQY